MAKVFQVDTNTTLTGSLLAYYKLEDVTDFWSTFNLTNGTGVAFNAGKVSNAADGGTPNSTKSLYIDNNSPMGLTNQMMGSAWTVACWVNAGTLADGQMPWGIASNTGSTQRRSMVLADALLSGSHYLQWSYYDGASFNLNTTQKLSTGTWFHTIASYDGALVSVYYNNNLVGTLSVTWNQGADAVNGGAILGQRQNGNTYNFFGGLVDEMGLWSRALNATERADLYNAGAGQTMITSTPAAAGNSVFFGINI